MLKKCNLPDIQAQKPTNPISLNRVGVTSVDFPIYIKTKKGGKVLCHAKVNLYVSLTHNVKGINMSRTIRKLMKYKNASFGRWVLWKFLYDLKKFSETSDAYAEVSFTYFVDKIAPVTKEKSVMPYKCSFIGHVGTDNKFNFKLRVVVLGTSNCPCSKEISEYGAHGQRSEVTVTIETKKKRVMWIEDIVNIVEKEFSCEIYPVLKRPDEKYVTEKAYNNPKFVEDIARDVARGLEKSGSLKWFKVKVENHESIHTHNAVAYIERILKNSKWRSARRSLKKSR